MSGHQADPAHRHHPPSHTRLHVNRHPLRLPRGHTAAQTSPPGRGQE